MKHMKKLIAVMLTFVMAFAMAATVFAEDAAGNTLTIKGKKAGHTYQAYQIFTGDLSGNVLSNVEWSDEVDGSAIIEALNGDTTPAPYSTAGDVAKALGDGTLTAENFADIVAGHLKTTSNETNTSSKDEESGEYIYTINELADGYYFIKDKDETVPSGDAYTKYVLKIVKDTTMTPKSDVPETEKKVYENVKTATNPKTGEAGTNYNDVADYNIGDTVPYAFYSKVSDMTNYKSFKYIFEDKMSAGLTFNANSVKVKIGETDLDQSKYEVKTTDLGDGDECTFHVEIPDLKALATELGVSKGTEIRVDFTATLNQDAAIGLDGNPNTMKLKFSNNPNDEDSMGETPEDKVIVFTYELDVTKKAGEKDSDGNAILLSGAEFVLYKKNGDEKSYVTVNSDKKVTGWTTDKEVASTLTSGANGLFKVIGLDDGTYYLEETKAPASYNLLKDPVTLVITATTKNDQDWTSGEASDALTALKIKVGNNAEADGNKTTGTVEATVENNKGATLPETGGVGTTIFYIVGAILIIGAGVLMITRRRMNNN